MKRLLLLLFLIPNLVTALPSCPNNKNQLWGNCLGGKDFTNETQAEHKKFNGEWKITKPHKHVVINETPVFFQGAIKDTQKYNHLNIYCIKDAIQEGKINYAQCVEDNKIKEITQQVMPNLDSSKNVGSYMKEEDETWFAHLADYFPKGKKNSGIYIYETAVNTGGTGYFSSIRMFELHDNNMLEYFGIIPGGDRCNDGGLEYISSDAEGMIYASSATDFRLLNYKYITDWRRVSLAHILATMGQEDLSLSDYAKSINLPSFFQDIEPYKDIYNGAIGCVGNIVRFFDFYKGQKTALGIIISKDFLKDREYIASETGQACLDKWKIQHRFSKYKSYKEYKDSIYIDSKDWDNALVSFQNYSLECSLKNN